MDEYNSLIFGLLLAALGMTIFSRFGLKAIIFGFYITVLGMILFRGIWG